MVKKKSRTKCERKLETTEERCPGSYELSESGGYPVFICSHCKYCDESWKKFYTEYLKLYEVKENWDIEKNKVSCVLGLFCFLYKQRYGVEYLFVPQSPNPFSAKECKDVWTIIRTFGNMEDTRKYLIWAFKKGIGNNAKITSLAYLKTHDLIRKFMLSLEKNNAMKRYSNLPEEFNIIAAEKPRIKFVYY